MEMQQIETENGVYFFEEKQFERGKSAKIDLVISKENLLLFKEIMHGKNIKFGLMYGTLLGAIRENNFIKHDEDTDIYILSEEHDKFINSLFTLKDNGFLVKRYANKELLSIMKNGQYIDVYFFKRTSFNKRSCDGYVIKAAYLEDTKEYSFLGQNFNIPKEYLNVLEFLYGKDWRTPKQNTPADNYGLYLSIKYYIQSRSKTIFKIGSFFKKVYDSYIK